MQWRAPVAPPYLRPPPLFIRALCVQVDQPAHGLDLESEEPNVRRTDRSKRFAGYGDNYRSRPI